MICRFERLFDVKLLKIRVLLLGNLFNFIGIGDLGFIGKGFSIVRRRYSSDIGGLLGVLFIRE